MPKTKKFMKRKTNTSRKKLNQSKNKGSGHKRSQDIPHTMQNTKDNSTKRVKTNKSGNFKIATN